MTEYSRELEREDNGDMVWDRTGLTEWMNKEDNLRLGLLDALKFSGLYHKSKAKKVKTLCDHVVDWGKGNFMWKPTFKKCINRKPVQQLYEI